MRKLKLRSALCDIERSGKTFHLFPEGQNEVSLRTLHASSIALTPDPGNVSSNAEPSDFEAEPGFCHLLSQSCWGTFRSL